MKTYCVWNGDAGYRYWLLAPSKDRAKELVISNISDFMHEGDEVGCEVDDKPGVGQGAVRGVGEGVILRNDGTTFTILNA
jgi:hypothetical protein